MSRVSEIIAITHAARHCAARGCRECIGRARWRRRKKQQSRKSLIRRVTGRK
jgi:hypothetical protein